MTKQQILDALEGLKDLTNDSGKREIDAVKAGILFLQEDPEQRWPVKEREADKAAEPEPIEAAVEETPEPEPIHVKHKAKHKVSHR